jgi:hypothetical protein
MNELIEQLEDIREDLTSTRVEHTDRTESALVHITKAVELLKEELDIINKKEIIDCLSSLTPHPRNEQYLKNLIETVRRS